MTEEIHLGVYEKLLNDYESNKERYAADLAYAACCLGYTITSEEIARNENAVTFAVGLPLALSSIDEEIWKGYLSKPVNGTEKLKEFLEGVDAWNRGNLSEDSDFDRLLKFCETMEDNWYSQFFTWVKFCEMEADFDNHNDTEKWKNEISPLWEQSKSDHLKVLLCLKVLFCVSNEEYGRCSLYIEKPTEESKDPWHQSFYLAQKIIEDSIETFTNERTKKPFALFLIGNLLENAGWDDKLALILGEMEVDKNPSKAIALFQKAGDLGLTLLSKIKLAEMAEHGYYKNEKAANLYSQVLKSDDLDCTDNTYELFHTVKGIMRSGCSLAEVFSVRSSYYSNETSHLVNVLQQTLKENREMVPSEEVIEPITDESGISLCQDILRLHLVDVSTEVVESIIGAQYGSGRSSCLWFEKYHIWSTSWRGSGDYYLNSFGIQSPLEQSHLSQAVQINPAYKGTPGKTGGGFVMGKNNRIYLIHTGKIGGGKKGIGSAAFWHKYKGLTAEFKKQRDSKKVAVIAELGTTNFVQCIVEFVKFVANEIKGNKVANSTQLNL